MQFFPALRMGMKRYKEPRDRIRFYARIFDALERDYLSAYPDEKYIFENGMEKELERLIKLKNELI